jgi:hypothetical protein
MMLFVIMKCSGLIKGLMKMFVEMHFVCGKDGWGGVVERKVLREIKEGLLFIGLLLTLVVVEGGTLEIALVLVFEVVVVFCE